MILLVGLLLLAVVGTPIYALLGLFALIGFLDALGGDGWAPLAFAALGRRGLNAPELATVPMSVFAAQLLAASELGARLRSFATPWLGASGLHAGWRCLATLSISVIFCGVLEDLPLRTLALSAAFAVCTAVAAAVLLGRNVEAQAESAAASVRGTALDALMLSALSAGFLSGGLALYEAAACAALYAVGVELIGGRAHELRSAVRRLARSSIPLCGAWLFVMVAAISVIALLEQGATGPMIPGPGHGVAAYRVAVCVGLGAELARNLWPSAEQAAAAYLEIRYGAPMTAATRVYVGVLLILLALCALVPTLTTWLPNTLGYALTASE